LAGRSEAAPAALTARRDAGGGLHLVTLRPAPDVAAQYRAPGQYVQVLAGAAGYFVLAGDMGAAEWELLVRKNGGAADALVMSAPGTALPVVGPLGEGFPLERARGRRLVLAVVGSALAVARPILRDRLHRAETAATSIYVGARSLGDLALVDELASWARAGSTVVLCLSGPLPDGPDAALGGAPVSVRAGWVQRVLAQDVEGGRLADALVFAAGPEAMLNDVRALVPPTSEGGPTVALEVVTNV
jgi:NAD(P)H-flavin reductase